MLVVKAFFMNVVIVVWFLFCVFCVFCAVLSFSRGILGAFINYKLIASCTFHFHGFLVRQTEGATQP